MFDKTVGDMRTMCFVLKQNPPVPKYGRSQKEGSKSDTVQQNIPNIIIPIWNILNISNQFY